LLTCGKSIWPATRARKFGRRLPPLVRRKVALPLSVTAQYSH
jgi:hypothetical protein